MKQFILVISLLVITDLSLAQDSLNFSGCLVNSHTTLEFDLEMELNRLETQLFAQKIITKREAKNYSKLFNFNYLASLNLDPSDFSIKKYLSLEAFEKCNTNSTFENNNQEQRIRFLYMVYSILAQKFTHIQIEVLEGGILKVNGQSIKISELESQLEIEMQKKKGIPRDEFVAIMKVAPEVKMGFMVDIQQILSLSGVKKVNYIKPN
jgi:biopolymer transport protein ExbD